MTEQFSLKNAQRLPSAKLILSPLALVILAACGGGGGSNVATSFSRSGTVNKGPLKDALAFLDYDGDGVRDAGEPSVRTGADGSYSLTGAAGNENATLVAITDGTTIDTSSGTVLDGVTLSAPATATVVSMASTLMVEANLTEAQVQEALGITGDVDLLSFDPFADGANATLAAAIETTSQQVSAVVTSLSAAAKASGVSDADSFKESLKAVSTLVQEKVTAREGGDATAKVDLTDTTQLTSVADKVATAVATKAASDNTIDSVAFSNMQTTVVAAVENVNTEISNTITTTNFKNADGAKIYSVTQVLVDQVTEAVAAEKVTKGTGATSVTFSKASAVQTAAANAAPTDIDLVVNGVTLDEDAAVTVSEGTGSLAVATIAVTDAESSSGFTFSLAGDDAAAFSVGTDGILYLQAQPDYETKSSYSVTIQAKDPGGKTYAEAFTVDITDIDEAAYASKFQINTNTSSDATFTDYVRGASSTEASLATVDLTTASGASDFGTIAIDLTNVNAGLAGTKGFQSPELAVVLAKLPVVTGGSITETIQLTLVDGTDATRDAETERSFTISFDAVMAESGGKFSVTPQKAISVSYLGKGDESATTVSFTATTNDTLSYDASTGVLSVKLLSLVNEASSQPGLSGISTALSSAATFHATVTGLPLIDENGDDITSLTGKLNIADRDHTPYISTLSDQAATEDGSAITGKITAVDAEGDSISYGITDGTASSTEVAKVGTYGTLTINKATGNYSYVLDATKVDSLNTTDTVPDEFTISASDGKTEGNQTLTFKVTGVNDAVKDIKILDLANTQVDTEITSPALVENQVGAKVGAMTATDPEGGAVTYSIVDVNNGALFEIKAINGAQVLKLKDSITANYEANTSYSVTVQASDGTNTTTKAYTIAVTNVNETPLLAQPPKAIVTEDSGTDAIGVLVASDPDRGQTLSYDIDVTGNARTDTSTSVSVVGKYGTLALNKSTGAYTYGLDDTKSAVNALSTGETLTETFNVSVSDGTLTSAVRSLSVTIQGNNDAPNTIALSANAIGENDAGAQVGTLSSVDAEGDSVTYTLASGGDNENFEITSAGVLKLKDTVSADRETKASYDLTVSASDGNSAGTQALTVTVTDTPKEANQFWVSTDDAGGADAVITDYINGTTVATTNVDLANSNEILDFGTVYIDANNAALATSGSSSFKSPELSFYLDQVPTITGSQTLPITVTVTEGADASRAAGERQAVVTFDLVLTGDGTTANLVAPSGGVARVDYYGSNSTNAVTTTFTNDPAGTDPSVDNIIFVPGQNTGPNPAAVNLKILELLNKASALNPTSILGDGASLHLKVEGLPLTDENGTVASVEGKVIVKDLIAPTTTIARASYDSSSGDIVIQGTKFDELDVSNGASVLDYLDFSKLSWDINSDDTTTADVSFAKADFSAAVVTNSETLTLTLSSTKKSALEATSGYGSTGGDDALDVTAGFIRDKALNVTDGSTDAASNVTIVNLAEMIRISTDATADATLTDYLDSTTAATTSLNATVSGGVLNFGSANLDLINIKKAAAGDSNYKSPELTLTVDKAALLSTSKAVPVTLSIYDGTDGSRSSSERQIDIDFTLDMSGNGSTSSFTASANSTATLKYFAAGATSASTLTITNLDADTFTVQSGSNGAPTAIKLKTLTLVEKINSLAPSNVLDNGGDFFLSVTGLPIADEFGPITKLEGGITIKDLVPPTSTITSAAYNSGSGVITLTGTDFDTIGVANAGSVLNYLDFSKLSWDIEGDNDTTANVSFQTSDFSSAVVTNATTLTLTLTSTAKSNLEGTSGFAAAGTDKTKSSNNDTIDVAVGFISDIAGNKSATDAKANAAITFSDTTAPTVSKFSSTSADGAYGVGLEVNISATLSEAVLKGSTFVATLTSSGSDTVTLTAADTGTTVVGTYTVPAGRTVNDLSVSSFTAGTVYDVYGNQMTANSLPSGENLGDNSNISIDTTPPESTVSSVKYDGATGTLTITGTKFLEIGVSAGGNVKDYLDYAKLVWDIDYNHSGSSLDNVTFAKSDIDTAVVTNDTTLTIKLTSDAKSALHAKAGFAAEGNSTDFADAIDVTAGFIRDKALNPSADDGKDNAALTYADTTAPTVTGFTSTKADGAYGVGATIEIVAAMSEKVISSSTMNVTLDTTDVVAMTASSDGMTMTGTYTVGAGDASTDLNVSSFTTGTVKDVYGTAMTSTALPTNNNLKDNEALVIDTTAPTATISSVKYNGDTGVITFTGTNFNTLNVDNNDTVKEFLDYTKLTWDIDYGDSSSSLANVTFAKSDIDTAVVTNSTTLTVTLTSTKKDSLEGSAGFGATGDTTNNADRVVVEAGFIRDHALNAGNTDAKSDATLTYSDTTAPTVSSFTSTTADGSYGVGGKVNITATMSEKVIKGSTFVVTLDTGSNETVTLTAAADGTTLVGEYTVPSSVTSADLKVSSFTAGTVTDIYGNTMTGTTVPTGKNISNTSQIVIDTLAPTTTISSAAFNGSTGVITLTGANFDTLGVANGTDVKSQLNFAGDRFAWDIEGDNATTSNVVFAATDFTSVVVTNATTLTMTLNSTGLTKLTSADGYAGAKADGTISSSADTIDVGAGFIVDTAGNASTSDVKADAAITYSDTTRPTVTKFDSTSSDGSYGNGASVNVTATMSETVLKGSTFVATLDTGGTVTLTAAAAGTTLSGTYSVPQNVSTSNLKVNSYTAGTVNDIYGNAMNTTDIPTGQNLSNNASIVIDTTPPTATVSSVAYNSSTGVLTFTGTNYDTLGVSNGGSLSNNIDWTKFSWDIDASDSDSALANLTLAGSDVSAATLVSATSFTVTLTSNAKTTLEGSAGFAAQGASDSSERVDTIDITAGFLKDTAGNLVSDGDSSGAGDDEKADAAITFSDSTRPTVTKFSSTTSDGSYGVGDKINVTATMSESVIAGSTFDVTLSTGSNETVTLTASASGTTLTGSYTVPSNVSTADLAISSFTAGTVTDIYGNDMTSTTVPAGENLSNNSALVIDTQAPTATVTKAAYDASTGVITLTGTNFDTMGVDNGGDIKSQLDFANSKLSWDINKDGTTTADKAFAANDISTAVVTNATTITITLTSTAKDALAATTGFGAAGGTDTIDVTAGFIADKAGNKATTDAKADAEITYADATSPTVYSFSSTTSDGSYNAGDDVNITATMSESVLAGGQITVTLGTTDEVVLTAASTGTTLTGTYTVGSGDTSSDLTVSSYTLGANSAVVQDIYGNEAASTALPSGRNLADTSALVIDTTIPTSTISSAKYNGSTGVITITGENFNTLGVANGADVKSYLDWSKLSWDIDGDDTTTANVAFTESSVTSAIVTNETTLTITLTSTAKSALEGTTKFAAAGSADKLDVSAGFVKDVAGNAATTDAKSDAAITYSDTTAPKVTKFDTTSNDGTYGKDGTVNITATVSETILSGSSFVATLSTTDTVTLTASADGTTLSGTYTVGTGDSSADLTISSFTAGSVSDVYGNNMASTSIPNGQNLANNADIVIDTVPIFNDGGVTLTQSDTGNTTADQGDTITLKFTEAVSNLTAVAGQFSSATSGNNGAVGSTAWSNSNKTLTITLGANESYDTGQTITITDVQDAGGNSDDLTFSVS